MKALSISVLALGLMTAFAAPAFATPPEDTTCTSACIPDGVDTTMRRIDLSGVAIFGGGATSLYKGPNGYAVAEEIGGGGVDIAGSLAGDFCEVDCTDGTFTLDGYAFKHVTTGAGAMSEETDRPAMVWSEGGAAVGLQLSYGRSAFTPPGD